MGNLSTIIRAGTKKYGGNVFLKASSAPCDFPRLPSGIFAFDYATCGIPVGASSSIYGPFSTGKSYIAQKIVAQVPYVCFKCFNYVWDCKCDKPDIRKAIYLDSEGSFSWDWARSLGVPEDLIVVSGLIGEEYVDVFHSAIRADDVGLIVVDSLAGLVPASEMEGSALDRYVMTTARLATYMVRKGKTLLLKERRRGHNVAVLIINQVRMKLATPGQNPEEIPGGNASKHDFTLLVRTGRRAVKDKDSEGLPMFTTTSISLGGAMGKRKLLVLAGVAQFDVAASFEHEFTRGTPLDHAVVLKYAIDNGHLVKTTKGYTFSIAGREPLEVKTQQALLDLWYDDNQQYLSAQKGIIEAEKKKRLDGDKD